MAKSRPANRSGKRAKRPKGTASKLRWLDEPAEHDYPAAASFLNLTASGAQIEVITALLAQAPTVYQAAKDILRAARLPLLPADDPEVAKDLGRVADGVALSPILLVRGDIDSARALVVADGYHRVCTGYHLAENNEIPCRIADLPTIKI